jgi:hypothetical protein
MSFAVEVPKFFDMVSAPKHELANITLIDPLLLVAQFTYFICQMVTTISEVLSRILGIDIWHAHPLNNGVVLCKMPSMTCMDAMVGSLGGIKSMVT